MSGERNLLCAYLLTQRSHEKLTWNKIEHWQPEQGFLWVHLNAEAGKTKQWLRKSSGLDKVTCMAMLEPDPRPRVLFTPKSILVTMRGVNCNPGQDTEDMVSIRLWLDKHRIITTQRRPLLSVTDIKEGISNGQGPVSSADFLVMLIQKLVERIGLAVEELDEKVDNLEEAVMSAESRILRPQISDVRRQATMIRRYLAPQRDALSRLTLEHTELLNSEQRLQIRESTDSIIRHIEDLDELKDRAIIIQEELSSRLSEQLDKRMYLLSIVAVIFLPLTFITGLLGINVEGIPGARNPWGFSVVCIILLGIFIGILWVFKRQKWV